MSDQPLDTVSTAIVERRTWSQAEGKLSQAFVSTTVQYLLRWSQVEPRQRTTNVLIDPTGGRPGCVPAVSPPVPHMALLPILAWNQTQSPECNTTTQILTAHASGAVAAVFHLPEGQSDQSTIRRTSLSNLPIPVLLLTDQAFSIDLHKSVMAANLSLTTPNVGDAPTRVIMTINPRAEVGMSSTSTWSIVGITVGVALGAVLLTSLLMHVQLWRMRRQRARKAFVQAVHNVEERVLAHQHDNHDDDEGDTAAAVADHLLAKSMLDDLPISAYSRVGPRPAPHSKRSSLATASHAPSSPRDSRRFSVYSLLSRLDHTPLAAAPEARAARDRRVASWLVPNDPADPTHLLPLSPRMRTSIVSSRSSLDYAHEARARVKENLSPQSRTRSPLATDRVPRDPVAPPRRARPVSFHPDTRGGESDAAPAFVVPPMSPTLPSLPSRPTTPTSPTVGHRPALAVPKSPQPRGSWASLDTTNPRAKVAENLGERRTGTRPLSLLNPAAAPAPRRSMDHAHRASRPVSVIHTLFPLLPGSPYLHADTDPAAGSSAGTKGNDSCPICVDALAEGDQVRHLPCTHVFHVACVDAWLTEEVGECPLCKFDVRAWWEGEFGEDVATGSSEEDEQEEEVQPRKGGWFARVLGRGKKHDDEERGLEPVPRSKPMRVAKEEVALIHQAQAPSSDEGAPATTQSATAEEATPGDTLAMGVQAVETVEVAAAPETVAPAAEPEPAVLAPAPAAGEAVDESPASAGQAQTAADK